MTTSEATQLRKRLLALCKEIVEVRVHSIEEAICSSQESANQEGKSSAGDKYETGRAMAQLEIENASGQLGEARKLLEALERIQVTEFSDSVRVGSLVGTNQANYFLSIPAGKLDVDGTTWYAISPGSPIGHLLMGLRVGDTGSFNKKDILIMSLG